MFKKKLFAFFFIGCVCNSHAMHTARSSFIVENDTSNEIVLNAKSVTEGILNPQNGWSEIKDKPIPPRKRFSTIDDFKGYNQYNLQKETIEVREIEVKADGQCAGNIILICAIYSPNPSYIIKPHIGGKFTIEKKKSSAGGGPTVWSVVETKYNSCD